ncbi:uncharacterized protein LOC142327479 [Lycorma delicatula]|uniref:uncharacterized protein LOC142327479 n=1 Tax=Lycorma delicatula TaxID=130591 RepID=UPI003F515A6E
MALFKAVVLFAAICVVRSQVAVLPAGYKAAAALPEPYDPHPQYSYSYSVQDPLTGDSKSQQESRDGDVVQGSYSLVEPDGSLRTVEYSADPVSGFNAVVHNSATGIVSAPAAVAKAAPAPIAVAPKVAAIPAPVIKAAAPAPVYKAAAAAPVYKAAAAYPYAYSGYPYSAVAGAYPYSAGYGAYPYSAGYSAYPYSAGYAGYPYRYAY